MPVTYAFSPDGRTIRTRCAGLVTIQEVVEHFHLVARDPLCPTHVDVFLDLSELDAASIPHGLHLSRVVLELKGIKVRFGACAVLAPGDAVFGMMRMFEALADEHFRTMHIFRDSTDAEGWLASQQSCSEGGTMSLDSDHCTPPS